MARESDRERAVDAALALESSLDSAADEDVLEASLARTAAWKLSEISIDSHHFFIVGFTLLLACRRRRAGDCKRSPAPRHPSLSVSFVRAAR